MHKTLIGAGLLVTLFGSAWGQAGPPAAASLEDITACSLEGDAVFVVTGRDATARRFKYPWDAAIDALCNAKGFAIGAPKSAAPVAAGARSLPTAPAAAVASGSGEATDFPSDAVALSTEAVTRKVSGKTFDVQFRNGTRWRLEFKGNGYLFVNATGGTASGPWRAEESRICSHMRGSAASCNEVREQGPRLYLKRDNGDVIALNPQ